jgi:hypothetical protein
MNKLAAPSVPDQTLCTGFIPLNAKSGSDAARVFRIISRLRVGLELVRVGTGALAVRRAQLGPCMVPENTPSPQKSETR